MKKQPVEIRLFQRVKKRKAWTSSDWWDANGSKDHPLLERSSTWEMPTSDCLWADLVVLFEYFKCVKYFYKERKAASCVSKRFFVLWQGKCLRHPEVCFGNRNFKSDDHPPENMRLCAFNVLFSPAFKHRSLKYMKSYILKYDKYIDSFYASDTAEEYGLNFHVRALFLWCFCLTAYVPPHRGHQSKVYIVCFLSIIGHEWGGMEVGQPSEVQSVPFF